MDEALDPPVTAFTAHSVHRRSWEQDFYGLKFPVDSFADKQKEYPYTSTHKFTYRLLEISPRLSLDLRKAKMSTALVYIQSIDMLPQWAKDALANPTQLTKRVDANLQGAAVLRRLSWRTLMPTSREELERGYDEKKAVANLRTLFIYVIGQLAPDTGCGEHRCAKIFSACVVPQDVHQDVLNDTTSE